MGKDVQVNTKYKTMEWKIRDLAKISHKLVLETIKELNIGGVTFYHMSRKKDMGKHSPPFLKKSGVWN